MCPSTCIGCYTCCGMYIPLSDNELRIVQKIHLTRANGHCLRGRNCNKLYQIPQLYFVCNHLIKLCSECTIQYNVTYYCKTLKFFQCQVNYCYKTLASTSVTYILNLHMATLIKLVDEITYCY